MEQMRPEAANTTGDLVRRYTESQRRLILLDYDGTLAPFAYRPEDATPSKETLQLLHTLAFDERNHVHIVSGRQHSFLERWLNIRNVTLISEHGAGVRQKNSEWVFKTMDESWKPAITQILKDFCSSSPGSFIENKRFALVWHYRMMDSELGLVRSKEVLDIIMPIAKQANLDVLSGSRVIEVKPNYINKGLAISRILEQNKYDFIIAVGDDKTDEDMFKVLPDSAYTIKVGNGYTSARYRILKQDDVPRLLARLSLSTQVRHN
ncbi:MAG: trehalose-phosphatase [Chryseolinea sp.]